jgi:4-amino-4-deoxy-L-arabinose transferase-like glycosyltransferase
MISSIIDQIPWWVYLGVMIVGAGVAWYFLAPILLPLWKLMPNWLKVTLGVIVAVFLAFIKGRNTGHSNAVKEQEKRNAEGEAKRNELHNQVERLPSSDVDDRLSKWMRD